MIQVKVRPGAQMEDHGEYDPKTFTISVRLEDPETLRISSFVHELMHAIEHVYTLEMDHTQLNLFSESITQVLVDNFKSAK
jgi:hypothetical protein